ncbi:MAG: hypothetical protein C4560_07120 [Nitrospiraceae bacterium]|nr:MAG: hypothetical protein C4560_07120 [Nitrospiraceae bacterium]
MDTLQPAIKQIKIIDKLRKLNFVLIFVSLLMAELHVIANKMPYWVYTHINRVDMTHRFCVIKFCIISANSHLI